MFCRSLVPWFSFDLIFSNNRLLNSYFNLFTRRLRNVEITVDDVMIFLFSLMYLRKNLIFRGCCVISFIVYFRNEFNCWRRPQIIIRHVRSSFNIGKSLGSRIQFHWKSRRSLPNWQCQLCSQCSYKRNYSFSNCRRV